jgi:hypothetical protein
MLPTAPASAKPPLDELALDPELLLDPELAFDPEAPDPKLAELDATEPLELPELPGLGVLDALALAALDAADPPLVAMEPDDAPLELPSLDPDVAVLAPVEASGPDEDPEVPQPTANTNAMPANSWRREREARKNSDASIFIGLLLGFLPPDVSSGVRSAGAKTGAKDEAARGAKAASGGSGCLA